MNNFRVSISPDDAEAARLLVQLGERARVEPLDYQPGRTLVLGGARSGKSTWAEAQLAGRENVDYVATSGLHAGDSEWAARIMAHRARRPDGWQTLETLDVASVLRRPGSPVLVDCLALWLTRTLDGVEAWDDAPGWEPELARRVDALVRSVEQTSREVILVSNEVGSGVVPAHRSGRIFRDELGRLNARVARACDATWLVTAGIARRLA